ncbi:MAG TPA: TonB-dependent receptor [Holophagaceae bacterium]|nr:TonB-dependent receptor [Holophagaceae bacterium]
MRLRSSHLVWILAAGTLAAQAPQETPTATVQVTATRFAENPAQVPGSITVITGKELEDRGATDLRSALALASGVTIAPGGDGGPASSVPEFWGLREFDAFLLVVDGVPWGGAFNPALGTLDLHDVERIEVQRGAAPVMYGATSFVGVIHVIHRHPGESENTAELTGGSHSSLGGAVTTRLPKWAGFDSSLIVDGGKQGLDDPRAQVKRGHLLWRNRGEVGGGVLHFDLDGTWLQQDPASPHPRVGATLTDQVPLDANHNPAGAHLNERRVALNAGYEHALGSAIWTTTVALSRSAASTFRGFLTDVSATDPNANGFREHVWITDLYFDTHVAWTDLPGLKVVAGLDHLHGQGMGQGGDFDYFVNLDGSNPPGDGQLPPAADIRIDDRRDFSGLYGFAEWEPVSSLVIEAGARFNRTEETRRAWTYDFASATLDGGEDRHTETRVTGSLGLTWKLWGEGAEYLNLFANAKNAFKPAAVDFGLDSEAQILKPETARSVEVGLKGGLMDGRLGYEVDAFAMDFDNLVVSQDLGAGPVLVNAGKQRFKGMEGELSYRFASDLAVRASYSYHDARFRDYMRDFGGTPTQLAGSRVEMSPYHLVSLGLIYAPAKGLVGSLEGSYVGSSQLNMRNTAPTGGYATFAASVGYRLDRWELRFTGQNLTERREPVSESELGDAQYYRLPGRRVDATLKVRF